MGCDCLQLAWYRDRIGLTAWHPEPKQERWPPAPDGYPEEGCTAPVSVLRTPLHKVPQDPASRREHCGCLASRNMLHVCNAYCLRIDKATGEQVCRNGYGPDSLLRQPCRCPDHLALSRERSAEDALANADPPWCKTCHPDGRFLHPRPQELAQPVTQGCVSIGNTVNP
jgi:hypothetical protein